MDHEEEIAYLKGRVSALENVCAALVDALLSATADQHIDARGVFTRRLGSLKRKFEKPIHRVGTKPEFMAGFTDSLKSVENEIKG